MYNPASRTYDQLHVANHMTSSISTAEFKNIILSHGWFALKPFLITWKPVTIELAYDLPDGNGELSIKEVHTEVKTMIRCGSKKLGASVASHCLSLDTDLTEFYSAVNKHKQWRVIALQKKGRFLRSPSLYEDCCKAILSTNTTWQRTQHMVNDLVSLYGKSIRKNKAFPRPEVLADIREGELKKRIGCGYRAKYLREFARSAAADKNLYLSNKWHELDTAAFHDLLSGINGLGPVSVNYLSMIYWKPRGFNIDAYVARRCQELWGVSNRLLPEFLARRYSRLKRFAPILLWYEVTQHWTEEGLKSNKW